MGEASASGAVSAAGSAGRNECGGRYDPSNSIKRHDGRKNLEKPKKVFSSLLSFVQTTLRFSLLSCPFEHSGETV